MQMRIRRLIGAGLAATIAAAAMVQVTACAKPDSASTRPAGQETNVKVYVYNKQGEVVGPVESSRVVKSDEEWKKVLTPEQFKIARSKGTERPFCGNLLDNHQEGTYVCVGCGLPLYSSDAKFTSGTGWPSFFKPVGEGNIKYETDESHGMVRTEIMCARCDSHLGHIFDDGPPPTGKRHCVNSESLKFVAKADLAKLADPAAEKAAAPATQQAK
jgi:methionine-R-sulfoxide reductase